ncbi:hypothetical protein M5K25_008123 [Dendrobium thyrsiflorum]|uniref:Uncharacterized protein n=1 Tax=Dendrobium thyrsiflorum TaxID=117978 RepID=A0ABD0VF34_DENTH
MAGRKVEVLEGELGQLKTDFEEKISYFQNQFSSIHEKMDGRFAALEDLMKKMIDDKQKPASSETIGGHGRGGDPNPSRGRENLEVEVLEGDDGMPPLEPLSREELSRGYDRQEAEYVGRREEFYRRGAGFERIQRRGADFEGGRVDFHRRGADFERIQRRGADFEGKREEIHRRGADFEGNQRRGDDFEGRRGEYEEGEATIMMMHLTSLNIHVINITLSQTVFTMKSRTQNMDHQYGDAILCPLSVDNASSWDQQMHNLGRTHCPRTYNPLTQRESVVGAADVLLQYNKHTIYSSVTPSTRQLQRERKMGIEKTRYVDKEDRDEEARNKYKTATTARNAR